MIERIAKSRGLYRHIHRIAAMGVEKITIGENIPAYEIGDKTAPAVIVIQVDLLSSAHNLTPW